MFTCVAANSAGSVRQDVRLSVNMRPVFKEKPGDVTLNVGQSLALSCHAQGTPTPVIHWTANNSPYPGTTYIPSWHTHMLLLKLTLALTPIMWPYSTFIKKLQNKTTYPYAII